MTWNTSGPTCRQALSHYLDILSLGDQTPSSSKKEGSGHIYHTDTSSFTNTASASPYLSDLDEGEARDAQPPQEDLLEIVSTPDRGQAVFTTRKIKAGTLLLAERPLIRLQKHEEDDPEAIAREFSLLSRADQKVFLKLFDAQKSRMARAASIYYSNCYNCDSYVASGQGGSAVGVFASRINHGCVPNVQFCYDEPSNEMRFHAIRDIPRGKELCSNYDKAVFEVRSKRQRKQQIYYGFICRCEACEPKTEFWARSDERRMAMYDAFKIVQACEKEFLSLSARSGSLDDCESAAQTVPGVSRDTADAALGTLVKLEELLLKECLAGVPLANTYRSLAKWAERKRDYAQAVKWKGKELDVCRLSFGSDALRTKGVQDKMTELEETG
ncbi:hypothetical protein PV08_10687 [Exophiala spinifera]|uniref:SET domain-containing protein n=1 Tax=Exophiala spinifera TaxID=91928 RepID=A0A0D1ZEH6_9EURO|nr:uncharacterized protein PV08_10687 [Exophiala spinifera]KIW11387.1 hypothetical protein PV08_10687 [Exophiala spinifera]